MITVREALSTDCSFLAKIILMAESTGFEITSYEKMFNKTNEELEPVFEKIINNEIKGHPLTWTSYIIATINDVPAAAISVYKEPEAGSNQLMTGALMMGFDRVSITNAFKFLKEHQAITIPKTRGTFQIDCVSTLPEYRGKGLLKELIKYAENKAVKEQINELQIQVWKKNEGAVKAYEKLGFKITEERLFSSDLLNGKVLMTKII